MQASAVLSKPFIDAAAMSQTYLQYALTVTRDGGSKWDARHLKQSKNRFLNVGR